MKKKYNPSLTLCQTEGKFMLITNEWETLAEVSRRTKTPGEIVIAEFQKLFRAGQLQFRMDEQDGVKVTLIRLKQEN